MSIYFKKIFLAQLFFAMLFYFALTHAEIQPELHNLSNAELLNQSQQLLTQTNHKFYAQIRGLAAQKALIERHFIEIEIPKTTLSEGLSLQESEKNVAQIKLKLKALTQQYQLFKQQQQRWQHYLSSLETSQKTVLTLLQQLEKMEFYAQELSWRVEDKTLDSQLIPKTLQTKSLSNQQQLYQKQIELWQQQQQAVKIEKETFDNHQNQAQAALSATEHEYAQLEKNHQRLQHKHALKLLFQKQALQQLEENFNQQQAEKDWLSGAYYLAQTSFQKQHGLLKKSGKELESLPFSELENTAMIQEKTLEDLKKQFEKLSKKLELLKKHQSQFDELKKQGELFKSEATKLEQHLFEMQVLGNVINSKKGLNKPQLDLKPLQVTSQKIQQDLAHGLSVLKNAIASQQQKNRDLEATQSAFNTHQKKHHQLVEQQQLVEQEAVWRQELIGLADDMLLSRYQNEVKAYTKQQQTILTVKQQLAEHQLSRRELQSKWSSLKDPLSAGLQEHALEKLSAISSMLYGLAQQPIPEKPQAKTRPQSLVTKKLEKWATAKEQPLAGLQPQLLIYQSLLASQVQVLEERQSKQVKLTDSLNTEQKIIATQLKNIEQLHQNQQQQKVLTLEIKKRLAWGKFKDKELPPELMQVTTPETSLLTTTKADLLLRQRQIKFELKTLFSNPEQQATIKQSYQDLSILIGRKLDVLNDRKKLMFFLERKIEDLSPSEQKNLEQQALKLLQQQNSFSDTLLSLFSSKKDRALLELLHVYYQGMLRFERKQANLVEQKKTLDQVLESTEDEKPLLVDLIEVLKAHIKVQQLNYAAFETRLKAQLVPQQAQKIIAELETKTGKRIQLPPLISQQERPEFLKTAVEQLFDQQISVLAAQTWLKLFEDRLSRFGIDVESSVYQQENGDLESRRHSLKRQEKSLQEQIDEIRREHAKIRQNIAFWAVAKLFLFLGIAIMLVKLIDAHVWHKMEVKAERQIPGLVRGMVAFVIYLISFFMVLSFVFGQTLTGILATSGVFAMIIGLAVQMNISNIFSGLAVNLEHPFKIGDFISVGDYEGVVMDMNWRTTGIRTMSAKKIYIPNHTIAESPITNFHAPEIPIWYGPTVLVPIEYDPKEVEALFLDCLKAVVPECKPWVMFVDIHDGAAEYWVWYELSDYALRNEYKPKVWHEIWQQFNDREIPFAVKRYEVETSNGDVHKFLSSWKHSLAD